MNSKINCLIVDDEPLAIGVVKDYINQVPQLNLVDTCADAMQAFQKLSNESIDLVFLDIEMPGMNGIEFIKSLSNPPSVILTTAYREYAMESYEIEVVDYLLKPISFNRFFKAVNKYLNLNKETTPASPGMPASSRSSIFVYSDKKNVKVYLDDILYVESIKDYIRIHTLDRTVISKDTISKYERLLPDSFLRVHRSFIINTLMISAFTTHDVELGSLELPIGTSYKKAVSDKLKE